MLLQFHFLRKEKGEMQNRYELNLRVVYGHCPRGRPGSWDLPAPEQGRTGHKALLKDPDGPETQAGCTYCLRRENKAGSV